MSLGLGHLKGQGHSESNCKCLGFHHKAGGEPPIERQSCCSRHSLCAVYNLLPQIWSMISKRHLENFHKSLPMWIFDIILPTIIFDSEMESMQLGKLYALIFLLQVSSIFIHQTTTFLHFGKSVALYFMCTSFYTNGGHFISLTRHWK